MIGEVLGVVSADQLVPFHRRIVPPDPTANARFFEYAQTQ
jgi:hypothetical protein